MSATLSKTVITPSVLSTTMTGCKCSEIFLMNEDRTQSFVDVPFTTATALFNPGLAEGPLVRINSEGWSTLLVWEVLNLEEGSGKNIVQSKLVDSIVMGKRPAFNSTATDEGVLDGSGSLYVNNNPNTISGLTGLFTWEPCPVINNRPNPGRVSTNTENPSATEGESPPMGCHSLGNVFTFGKGPIFNNPGNTGGANLQPYRDITEIKFSNSGANYLSGPAVIDVSSTTQIIQYPIQSSTVTGEGYFVGQFIS